MKNKNRILIAAAAVFVCLAILASSFIISEEGENTSYEVGAEATKITSLVYLTDPKTFAAEDSYDSLETIYIESGKNNEGCGLDFAREIVPNGRGYYIAGSSAMACVNYYSFETGGVKSIQLPFIAEDTDISSGDLILRACPNVGQLFVAVPKINRVGIFDLLSGAFIDSKAVPFNFQSFAPSPDADAFIFYSPMNIHQGRKSILITDESFNINYEFFTPPSIIREANWLASNSFKVYNSKVYFNPPTSGDIYEVLFDGSMKKVFSGPAFSEALIKYVQSMDGEQLLNANAAYEAGKYLPIYDFQITEDQIAFQYFKNRKYFFTTVVERETGRAIAHQNAIFVDHIGDHLKYVFLTPTATENGDFLSSMNSESIGIIQDNVSASVHEASKDFDLAVFKFSYNFDDLYRQGSNDTAFDHADDEKNEAQKSNLVSNLLAFPNPIKRGDDRLQIKITFSPENKSFEKRESVVVQVLSANSSSIVYEQKCEVDHALRSAELSIDSRNVPEGFSQILVLDENGEVLGTTSIVNMK